jgi:S1-C subfamily serine protease
MNAIREKRLLLRPLYLPVILLLILFTSHLASATASEKQIQFFVGARAFTTNGTTRQMDVAPFIGADGRVQVPVRYLALALGVEEPNIVWDAGRRTITLMDRDHVLQMTIGSRTMLANGVPVVMDTAPMIRNGRTFLPARYVAQALGWEVAWIEGPQVVRITKSVAVPPVIPQKLTAREIVAQNGANVVYITTLDSHRKPFGQGSGFIASADGKVVTNWHVIEGASLVTVSLLDGRTYTLSELSNYDSDRDIAVLQLTCGDVRACVLGDSDCLAPGDEITVIGNPQELRNSVTTGVVSSTDRLLDGKKWLQISAPVSPGSSGGPVFNDKGGVVGVVTMGFKAEFAQNLNFAVPINEVKPLLETERPAALTGLFRPAAALSYGEFAAFIEREYKTAQAGPYILTFKKADVKELNDGTLAVSLILDGLCDLEWLNAQISGYKGDIERWLKWILAEAENAYPQKRIIVSAWLIDYYYFYPSAWPAECISLQPDGTWLVIYPKVGVDNFAGYPRIVWCPKG